MSNHTPFITFGNYQNVIYRNNTESIFIYSIYILFTSFISL